MLPGFKLNTKVERLFGFESSPFPLRICQVPLPETGSAAVTVTVSAQISMSAPAFATALFSATFTCKLSTEGGQAPLLIVQTNVTSPVDNPETPV